MRFFGVGGWVESSGARLVAAVSVYLISSFIPSALADLPPPTVVSYNGTQVHLAGDVTVRDLLQAQGEPLKEGRLLDVTGAVLKQDAYPPEILVNGRRAQPSTALHEADIVELRGGRDVYEPSIVQTFANAGGNPQFTLGTGSVTVRRGLISKSTIPVETEGKGPPQVALTFDDGPHPDWTPKLLDVLKKEKVKATFFVVGSMAEHYPNLVRREVADGMAVGDHSWTHPHLAGRDHEFVDGQLRRTRDVLKNLGADVSVFRPPYGSYNPSTVAQASSLKMRTIIWSIDPADYRRPSSDTIVRRIMNQLKPGAIILMHDGGGDRSNTVAAVSTLIEQIRKRGYGFSVLR
jgi:peptidoglycan/xylan/chitin deacetylase (PgdA/CDA1 family)